MAACTSIPLFTSFLDFESGRSRCDAHAQGIQGLYKGLLPNVLRVMPQSAITFLVYEKVMQLLDSHSRSSMSKT